MKVSFSKEEWVQSRMPCVYQFLDKLKNPLYIGYGQNGFSRVFSGPNPHHKNREEAIETCSSIEVEFFSTRQEAVEKERQEIHMWHPAGNLVCRICSIGNPDKIESRVRKAPHVKRVSKPAKWFLEKYPNGMTDLKPVSV